MHKIYNLSLEKNSFSKDVEEDYIGSVDDAVMKASLY